MVKGMYTRYWTRGIHLRRIGIGQHNTTGTDRNKGQPWRHHTIAYSAAGIISTTTGYRRTLRQTGQRGNFTRNSPADGISRYNRRKKFRVNSKSLEHLLGPDAVFHVEQAGTSRI